MLADLPGTLHAVSSPIVRIAIAHRETVSTLIALLHLKNDLHDQVSLLGGQDRAVFEHESNERIVEIRAGLPLDSRGLA